tara:strand:- start:285 stop:674 length:390 start_codon:yes stop_codon:yes gene_type:complete
MNQISDLLDSIYSQTTGTGDPAIEKTAEARLLEALSDGSGEVEENPFESLSLDKLTKLAQDHNIEVEDGDDSEAMEKAAFDALGGQVMAHAAFHELNLIKTALVNGQCRLCKDNGLDVEGSSICSTCLA